MKSSLKLFVRILTSTILFFSFYSAQAQTVTVPAANTNNGSVNDPFGTYWGFERSAMIYSSAQIGTTGNINSVGLESLNVFCEFPHPLLFEDAQKPYELTIRAT